MSRLDQVYRSVVLTKFFTKGWGKPENLRRILEFRKIISDREQCKNLVQRDYPVYIDRGKIDGDCKIMDGYLTSPFVQYLGDLLPAESHKAHFQMVLPREWHHSRVKPVVIQLAGTGDHYFWRRRLTMAKPLLKQAGIASIILENPFYGHRKPKEQKRSSLCNVSDIFIMGGCLVLECLALLHYCEREGFGPVGLTGISMGGHMASLAATNWSKPIALVPCMSWSTASIVFTQGVMSGAIPWDLLENQYFSDGIYRNQLSKMLYSPEENSAFEAGRAFIREMSDNHSKSSSKLKNLESTHYMDSSASFLARKSNTNCDNKSVINWGDTMNLAESLAISKSNIVSKKWARMEAFNFMRGIMDECTHIGNFSRPVDTTLAIIVCAKYDVYYPRDGLKSLEELWPGSEVRYIDAGHIAGFLFHQSAFRAAIIDAFQRLIDKYWEDKVQLRKG